MIIVAVLMVPILLFGKPLLFKMEQNKSKNHAVSYCTLLLFVQSTK